MNLRKWRTTALWWATALVGCGTGTGTSDDDLPPPACRAASDCTQSGMPGAACMDGRCVYAGTASGTIQFQGESSIDLPLRIAVFREEDFAWLEGGPTDLDSSAKPVVPMQEYLQPAFPLSYELSSLPDGNFGLFVIVDDGANSPSPDRPCLGDDYGFRKFFVEDRVGRSRDINGDIHETVDVVEFWVAGNSPFCD